MTLFDIWETAYWARGQRSMDAILAALVALMGLAAAMAAVLSTLSKAAIFALLAAAPCIFRYRKRIYIIIKTLPRDTKFLWRYFHGIIRSKKWGQQDATVPELFTKRALKTPNAPCFFYNDHTYTFAEMAEWSNRVAHVMQKSLGLKRGDSVYVYMPNSIEFIWSWLGVSKLGGISALINYNLRKKPLLHCIQVPDAKAIIFCQATAECISEIRSELPKDLALYQWGGNCAEGVFDLSAALKDASIEYPIVPEKPHYKDPIMYIYTSGTTGMPKVAVMPHCKYLLVMAATVHMVGLRSTDIMYNALPLYHLAGGIVGTGAALIDGIPSVIRPKFSASNYWSDCIKYKCTVAQYIGEMCRYLLAQPSKPTDTQHSVRVMVGNGMRMAIWQQMVDRFKIEQINEVYGATEGNANIINVDNTVGAVGFMPSIVPASLHPSAVIKADELGIPIRGPDGFCQRCAPNEPGMFIGLIMQGNASREYHGYVDKEASNKKVAENVFRKGDKAFVSGDIMVMDELGYLFFKDRTGDTYKWKGENVATAEVEGAVIVASGQRGCVVYGVSIPNVEGRVGMAAIMDPDRTLDYKSLAQNIDDSLPSFARPLFLRIMKDIEMTGTFKLKKLQLQKEGFDPDAISDPLYFRKGADFVPITTELFKDICEGRIKL